MSLKDLIRQYERKRGRQEQVKKSLQKTKYDCKKLNKEIKATEKAQEIINMVAEQTQKLLKRRITEPVSYALAAVMDEPFELIIDHKERRGKIEVDLKFKKGDMILNPSYSSSGGSLDIASLALRFTMWALKVDRTRNLIILDEPDKSVKGDEYPAKTAKMVRELSSKLGIQLVMVSHETKLVENADKIFYIGCKNNKSHIIKEIQHEIPNDDG